MGSPIGPFQTYHGREDVITGNVIHFLKMIQRLDGCAFNGLLAQQFEDDESVESADSFDDDFELQPAQDRSTTHSVPDAEITRGSYRILVEDKGAGPSSGGNSLRGISTTSPTAGGSTIACF